MAWKKTYELLCENYDCGKFFKSPYRDLRYCSDECRIADKESGKEAAKEPKRKCRDCGKPTYNYRCYKCRTEFNDLHSVLLDESGDPIDFFIPESRGKIKIRPKSNE